MIKLDFYIFQISLQFRCFMNRHPSLNTDRGGRGLDLVIQRLWLTTMTELFDGMWQHSEFNQYNLIFPYVGKCSRTDDVVKNHSTLTERYRLFVNCLEKGNDTGLKLRAIGGFALPTTSAPSSGAGCYGDHWHGRARSSSDKAGSHGTVGTDSGNPSCSRSGNMNIPPDGRLSGDKKTGSSAGDVTSRLTPLPTQTSACS